MLIRPSPVKRLKLINKTAHELLVDYVRAVTVLQPQPLAQPVCRDPDDDEVLGACRTWGVESENRPQQRQFLPDLQAHSPAMGQKDGEKWTAAVDLQPSIPKSDRLLALALLAQAQAIVSDDNDLLVLQTFEGIAIITAAQALQQLEVGG